MLTNANMTLGVPVPVHQKNPAFAIMFEKAWLIRYINMMIFVMTWIVRSEPGFCH